MPQNRFRPPIEVATTLRTGGRTYAMQRFSVWNQSPVLSFTLPIGLLALVSFLYPSWPQSQLSPFAVMKYENLDLLGCVNVS